MHFSLDVREPSLKKSAFCILFQVPSALMLNAPGLFCVDGGGHFLLTQMSHYVGFSENTISISLYGAGSSKYTV